MKNENIFCCPALELFCCLLLWTTVRQPRKSYKMQQTFFFLTEGQNNFGNKIPFLLKYKKNEYLFGFFFFFQDFLARVCWICQRLLQIYWCGRNKSRSACLHIMRSLFQVVWRSNQRTWSAPFIVLSKVCSQCVEKLSSMILPFWLLFWDFWQLLGKVIVSRAATVDFWQAR